MGDDGVKQRYDRGADGVRRGGAILVHSCGDGGAVVKHCQLSTKLLGLACADRLGKIGKEGPEPGAILLGNNFGGIAGSCLRGGADKPAPTELRPAQQLLDLGEHGEEAGRNAVRLTRPTGLLVV